MPKYKGLLYVSEDSEIYDRLVILIWQDLGLDNVAKAW